MAQNNPQDLRSVLKMLQDKFPNFLLGVTVLLIIVLFISVFFKKDQKGKTVAGNWTKIFARKEQPAPTAQKRERTYSVKQGDYLWTIAEDAYGSGYNAYDIANANKLQNPDLIEVGQVLVLPSVKPAQPTKGQMVAGAMTGKAMQRPHEYTIQSGDYLWKIAQTYYGDGYAWVKIARANKLANPGLIYAGNKLVLP